MYKFTSMKGNNLEKGKKGESIAEKFLIEKGFIILEKNWRFKHYEIDLIAKEGNTTVFIEVKTRNDTSLGFPEEAISKGKIKSVLAGAEEYLYKHPNLDIRFDVISILLNTTPPDIFHIRDAFY